MRYAGQGYEITVPCDADELCRDGTAGLRQRFDATHQKMFGHAAPEQPVEIVSYRLAGIGLVSAPPLRSFEPAGDALSDALREYREVRFDGETLACPVYQRERLDVGHGAARPRRARPVRLHDGGLPRPDRAGGCLEEPHHHRGHPMNAATDAIDAPPIDAIDLEVIRASLCGIVQEMQNALFRTGFSTIIRESQDASCALMDAGGEVVAQHVVLPLHIGAFPACCAAVLKTFGDDHRGGRRVPDQPSL